MGSVDQVCVEAERAQRAQELIIVKLRRREERCC